MSKPFRSVSRRVYIPDLKIQEVKLDSESGEVTYVTVNDSHLSIVPDFPVLIQSDGIPWTLGNIYLIKRLENTRKYESKTWENLSSDLLHYLRWLESNDIDPLYFHKTKRFERPTYRYRAHLINEINSENTANSTASNRMNTIIKFYKGLVAYNIIDNDILTLAWEDKQLLVNILGRDLQSKTLSITSTDLAIKKASTQVRSDRINDGGQLRPLSDEEQKILSENLRHSGMSYRLIFAIAILTGARLQTICTLRGKSLLDCIFDKENNRYLLHLKGGNQLVDTKKSQPLTIAFPAQLYDVLLRHWNSHESINRRLKSFYGNSETNYLFLNKESEPYQTSKQEIIDRRDPKVLAKMSLTLSEARSHTTRKGQSIWSFINGVLLTRIHKEHSEYKDFSFHDLRATFGMNTLETLLRVVDSHNDSLKKQGKESNLGTEWVLEQVQQRMGHKDIATTMRYLNFQRNQQFRAQIQSSVEDQLMKYIPSHLFDTDYE